MRPGQIIFGLWLFADWVVASELVWIITGRDPWWSVRPLSLYRYQW